MTQLTHAARHTLVCCWQAGESFGPAREPADSGHVAYWMKRYGIDVLSKYRLPADAGTPAARDDAQPVE